MSYDHPPCIKCGFHAKRADHQKEHDERCHLLPSLDDMLNSLQLGQTTRKRLAEEYSTIGVKISETFVVRLLSRFGYKPGSGNVDLLHKVDVEAWAQSCVPCFCCGLLTTDDPLKVPKFVSGHPQWFVGLGYRLTSGNTANWYKRCFKGDPVIVCRLCANELSNIEFERGLGEEIRQTFVHHLEVEEVSQND